jgi:CubicO group peptidase (beta-lactamase class C family)
MNRFTYFISTIARASCVVFLGVPALAQEISSPLAAELEKIRIRNAVPAIGAALFASEGLKEIAVAGVRKRGDATPATDHDLWHLGSDTKVMTSMLLGTYVAEGKLGWGDKVLASFPDLAGKVPPSIANLTLAQILSHQAGIADNLKWTHAPDATLTAQRQSMSRLALQNPGWPPGMFHYSNFDYVIAGAIVETIASRPWEELIQERVFQPLGITSAGFGGLGTPGRIDQPWPHKADGSPFPQNGPAIDNTPALGPAGTVHMTMTDWSKFLVDQLRGARGEKAFLPAEIYTAIQAPRIDAGNGMSYGFGWGLVNRPWAGGATLTHAGSNTLNYCVAWLAPKKGFGVLAVCNQGGDAANKACDDAASLMIQRNERR